MTELPGMLATLCSYQEHFGACTTHTLRLALLVAEEFLRLSETVLSRRILEDVSAKSARTFGPDHELRATALARLRDLFLAEQDIERATAVQRELMRCRPDSSAERSRFASMMLVGGAESRTVAA